MLNGLEGEESLYEASFHVENAGAERFSADDAKRHFPKRAGRIDGVVMAKNEVLAREPGFCRPPSNAKMSAAFALREALDARATFAPLSSDERSAPVGESLLVTRRLCANQAAEGGQHFGKAGLQEVKKQFGLVRLRHGRDMLTMRAAGSNGTRRFVAARQATQGVAEASDHVLRFSQSSRESS